jgi:hypothetical protein
LAASWAPITAAIDIRFIAILDGIRARKTRMRFQIAEIACLPAIGVGIAFDAIAFAIARFATTHCARRSLCQGRFYLRACGARGHVTIVGRRVGYIDGFFATGAVTLKFFAVARDLRE